MTGQPSKGTELRNMDLGRLGEFLRARRRALTPEQVGLLRGGLRRTPGLRREEVAMLADVSADYYERLEQSRATHPSPELLARLAEALQLRTDEATYLYHLAGHYPPMAADERQEVAPGMLFLLDSLDKVPAHVLDNLTNVLAQNALSVALFGHCAELPGYQGNMAWRWFMDPQTRALSAAEEHEEIGRGWAAELRAATAQPSNADAATSLIDALLNGSTEFATYWATMDVTRFRSMLKTFVHPALGALQFNCDMVLGASEGQRLMLLRPEPGTETANRLSALRGEVAAESEKHSTPAVPMSRTYGPHRRPTAPRSARKSAMS
jgi:transcriptional regulator with XRE-family HTH domain